MWPRFHPLHGSSVLSLFSFFKSWRDGSIRSDLDEPRDTNRLALLDLLHMGVDRSLIDPLRDDARNRSMDVDGGGGPVQLRIFVHSFPTIQPRVCYAWHVPLVSLFHLRVCSFRVVSLVQQGDGEEMGPHAPPT